MNNALNLLFVCSRNQWRSPTAEKVFGKKSNLKTRSAGTSPRAKRTISPADIRWADIIFVMEQKHKNRLLAVFTRMLSHKSIHVLDIPDDYKFMAPDLIAELESKVGAYLNDMS
jgi:predicted protein tyrosine phosphatase